MRPNVTISQQKNQRIMTQFSIFSSDDNSCFVESFCSTNISAACDEFCTNDFNEDILSVKHTHWNVCEVNYMDGRVSYIVISRYEEE